MEGGSLPQGLVDKPHPCVTIHLQAVERHGRSGHRSAQRSFSQCRSGGIGRRAWFRSMYSQGCGGSSPPSGTNSFTIPPAMSNLREGFFV
jgi:hypothetical protein